MGGARYPELPDEMFSVLGADVERVASVHAREDTAKKWNCYVTTLDGQTHICAADPKDSVKTLEAQMQSKLTSDESIELFLPDGTRIGSGTLEANGCHDECALSAILSAVKWEGVHKLEKDHDGYVVEETMTLNADGTATMSGMAGYMEAAEAANAAGSWQSSTDGVVIT